VSASLGKRAVSEALGTMLLVCAVVGSGIMAQRLFPQSDGLALLANTLATGGALFALILTFSSISGAHFNPVVSLDAARRGQMAWRDLLALIPSQGLGAVLGSLLAHAMFAMPILQLSTKARSGGSLYLAEALATFTLLLVIRGSGKTKASYTPFAVAGIISGAYWFTSSTSFANPAVTLGRMFSDSFAGIAPKSVVGFLVAQLVGGNLASYLFEWFEQD
jgi:glycerol uptake facilitator-like aquaporin